MISKKTKKAVDVCVYLCQHRAKGHVKAPDVASELGLSLSHLENILKSLRDRGLVVSTRGPGGGYAISDEGADSSVWDVAAIFEDTLAQAEPASSAHAHSESSYELGLEQVIRQTLSGFKIADVTTLEDGVVVAPARASGRFKFKPLAAPKLPRAANSVFQWHMVSTNNALFDAR